MITQGEVVDLLLEPEEVEENRELKKKTAVLHAKKTGHKKVKKMQKAEQKKMLEEKIRTKKQQAKEKSSDPT